MHVRARVVEATRAAVRISPVETRAAWAGPTKDAAKTIGEREVSHATESLSDGAGSGVRRVVSSLGGQPDSFELALRAFEATTDDPVNPDCVEQ